MAERIVRSRRKGWRMPDGAVYVGRPSRWGNPFPIGAPHPDHGWPLSREEAVATYRRWVVNGCVVKVDGAEVLIYECPFSVSDVRVGLRGKDLACWCPVGLACHADVLLELANA